MRRWRGSSASCGSLANRDSGDRRCALRHWGGRAIRRSSRAQQSGRSLRRGVRVGGDERRWSSARHHVGGARSGVQDSMLIEELDAHRGGSCSELLSDLLECTRVAQLERNRDPHVLRRRLPAPRWFRAVASCDNHCAPSSPGAVIVVGKKRSRRLPAHPRRYPSCKRRRVRRHSRHAFHAPVDHNAQITSTG